MQGKMSSKIGVFEAGAPTKSRGHTATDGGGARPDTMASEAATELRPGTSISGTSTRPGTMAAASRPGTTAASRPGTKTAPLPDGVRGDGIASGADVLAIPEDEDEDTGEHRAGGVVYAQPAGRTAPLQPRPVTAPETARSGLQTGGVRRRRRLDASEKEWVPYGWTSGYRRDELRESAVEDEMGGAGIALEIPDRSGSPTDDPLDLNMNPSFPPGTPQWFIKAELERLAAIDRNRQRDLEREAANRARAMMQQWNAVQAEKGEAEPQAAASVRLERKLVDGRFEFLIDAADRQLRDAQRRGMQAGAMAGLAEFKNNLIHTKLAEKTDEEVQEALNFAKWDAHRQERLFASSQFTMIGAIEMYSNALWAVKHLEEVRRSRTAMREEAKNLVMGHPQKLIGLEATAREVHKFRNLKAGLLKVAPRLTGHGGDLISMPKPEGGELLVKLERLAPPKEARSTRKRMTISDLLVKTTRELARPVEIKPYAPALKSGWMYLHGMNRVTKEDCWLRRWGQLMSDLLVVSRERPFSSVATTDSRPQTAPAYYAGSSVRTAAAKDPLSDNREEFNLKELAFVTPMAEDKMCLVTDDGVTTILRFQGGGSVRDSWRVALAYAVEGARKVKK